MVGCLFTTFLTFLHLASCADFGGKKVASKKIKSLDLIDKSLNGKNKPKPPIDYWGCFFKVFLKSFTESKLDKLRKHLTCY